MPDGKPDLTGVYGNAGLPPGTTPPPLKPGAEKFRIVRGGPNDVRGRTTITTGNDCNPLGVPQTYITPYPFQIVHTRNLVIIIYEYPNAIRFVPIDGRPQAVDPDPSWMGSSVGRWDGDTLVIDAIGFNDKTEVHGFMHTEALHVVERFRRLENGSLQYERHCRRPERLGKAVGDSGANVPVPTRTGVRLRVRVREQGRLPAPVQEELGRSKRTGPTCPRRARPFGRAGPGTRAVSGPASWQSPRR